MLDLPTYAYRAARTGAEMERENVERYDMPWRRRLWLYRHGFLSSRGVIYDLSDGTVDEYVNDVQARKVTAKYDQWSDFEITNNKLLFHYLFSRTHPGYVPELHALWSPDSGVRGVPDGTVSTLDDLLSVVEDRRLVMKPKRGWGGSGVHVLGHDDDGFRFDGVSLPRPKLVARLEEQPESIFTEYVTQAEYAARIYPEATNTLRVLVMVDPETYTPFIAAAVHRFGTAASGHVDNWSSGGLSAHVDAETGELGLAATAPKGGGGFARLARHPDTDEAIEGTYVPGWEHVREGLLEVANEYRSMLKYVGWDLVVTDEEGSFNIIEGNACSDLDLIQTHGPLLSDDRVERFYRHHGIL